MATVNSSSSRESWRMVYSGSKVTRLFKSSGTTQTIDTLFESSPTDGGVNAVTSDVALAQCTAFAVSNKLSIAPALLKSVS